MTPGRTHRKVRPDLDGAFRPGTPPRTAGEATKRCHDEDSESPSSNHMVPPCVCREARRSPSWRTPPLTRALFPTRVGARVRRRRMRPHGVAEHLLRGELSIVSASKSAGPSIPSGVWPYGTAVVSIWECDAVIFGPDEAPGKSWIRRARLEYETTRSVVSPAHRTRTSRWRPQIRGCGDLAVDGSRAGHLPPRP